MSNATAETTSHQEDLGLFTNAGTDKPQLSQDLLIEQRSDHAVTPTSSEYLVEFDKGSASTQHSNNLQASPFVRYLQRTGYYMTPGLRFGSMYSVYPGDPLRFHAHFMANEYGWEEEFSMLDIVGGGRLATAVKKAFLIGGKPEEGGEIKTFSIEWASM